MNAVPLVILAVVLSLGIQPTPKPVAPKQPPPPQPKVVQIRIVVGVSEEALAKQCGPTEAPSTIFVANNKQVFHCVGNKLLNHANHGKDPNLEKAVVRANAGELVRWTSSTRFKVVSVERHEVPGSPPPAKKNLAPDSPFLKPLPTEYLMVVEALVRNEPGTIVQRYKATFDIQGVGLVDPDLICSM